MQKFIILGLFAVLLLGACTGGANEQQGIEDEQSSLVTVYRSPT